MKNTSSASSLTTSARLVRDYADLQEYAKNQIFALRTCPERKAYLEEYRRRVLVNALNSIYSKKLQASLHTSVSFTETFLPRIEPPSFDNNASMQILEQIKNFFSSLEEGKYEKTPAEMILSLYENLTPPQDTEKRKAFENAVSKHIEKIVALAFEQHLDNPEQFTSHGFDHTLNVLLNMRSIYTDPQNMVMLKTIANKYGISMAKAKFCMDNIALFHDFGYSFRGKRGKSSHPIASAELMNKPEMRNLFRTILNCRSEKQFSTLMKDMMSAVLFHSADKVQKSYSLRLSTEYGDYLTSPEHLGEVVQHFQNGRLNPTGVEKPVKAITHTQDITHEKITTLIPECDIPLTECSKPKFEGRWVDLHQSNDNKLGLEYQEADIISENPFLAIRVGDNMDEAMTRLTPLQTHPAFQKIYETYGYDEEKAPLLMALEKKIQELQSEFEETMDDDESYGRSIAKLRCFIKDNNIMPGVDTDLIEGIRTFQEADELWKMKMVIEPVLAEFPDIEEALRSKIVKFALMQPSKQARHYSGCLALRDFKLRGNKVVITINTKEFHRLNQYVMREGNGKKGYLEIPLGAYKVWRAMDAFKSIKIDGQNIAIEVMHEDEITPVEIHYGQTSDDTVK